jgi:hypothetical protein
MDIAYDSVTTDSELTTIRDVTNGGYFNNNGVSFYCLIVNRNKEDNSDYGKAWRGVSYNSFAVFVGSDENLVGDQAETFMHELGHCLGLRHYQENTGLVYYSYDWTPYYPGETCMEFFDPEGSPFSYNYLYSESSTTFSWTERTQGNPVYEDNDYNNIKIGGWEFSCDYSGVTVENERGLLYRGMDNT